MFKGIIFRDRSLKPGEKYHHHCTECGCDVHPDMIGSHKCSPLTTNDIQGNADLDTLDIIGIDYKVNEVGVEKVITRDVKK